MAARGWRGTNAGGGVRAVVGVVLGVLLVGVVLVLGDASSEAAREDRRTGPRSGASAAARGRLVRELIERRTERSRTFVRADGSYEAQISSVPINYRGPSGRWLAIDNRLRRDADGRWSNAASDFDVSIPGRAGDPVRVTAGGRSLAFGLAGARSASVVRTAGAEATFADVVGGVDVAYRVRGKSLKETLTLASARAPSSYTFAVDAPDLDARMGGSGEVVFVDAGGRSRFTFEAPWMQDGAGSVSRAARYVLGGRESGRETVRLEIDRSWLESPDRGFPVIVDPTVSQGVAGVCELAGGLAADRSQCTASGPTWIGRENGVVHRAAVRLGSPRSIPPNAMVLSAQLEFTLASQTAAGDTTLDLYGLTRAFDTGATWNRATATTPWTTPGGDLKPARETRRTLAAGSVGQTVALGMPRLLQGYVDGSEPLNGVLIRAADESVDRIDVVEGFTVKVRFHARIGTQNPAYSLDRTTLGSASWFDVNVGNGNMTLFSDDVGFRDYDGRYPLGRYWNNQQTAPFDGLFGNCSRGDFSSIALEHNPVDGSYIFFGPTGTDGVFVRRPDGSYEPPAGTDATLIENANGTLTLTYEDSGEVWTFNNREPRHRIIRAQDPSGYSIKVDRVNARISDKFGAFETAGFDSKWDTTTLTDQDGRVDTYAYVGHDLVSRRDPNGAETRYTIGGKYKTIQRIDLPDRTAVKIGYDGDNRVTSVTPVDASGRDGAATTYGYEGNPYQSDTTIRTAPNGRRTVYTFDTGLLATEIAAGSGPPTLTLSGSLWDARGTTLPDGQPRVLSFGASDGAGIERVKITVDERPVQQGVRDCSNGCGDFNDSWTFDPLDYGKGSYIVRIRTTDATGSTRTRAFRVGVPMVDENADEIPEDADPSPSEYDPSDVTPCLEMFGAGTDLCDGTDEPPSPPAAGGMTSRDRARRRPAPLLPPRRRSGPRQSGMDRQSAVRGSWCSIRPAHPAVQRPRNRPRDRQTEIPE